MKVSYIIVHYNVAELLRNCVESIEKFSTGFAYEIIVIDNNSPNSDWKSLIDRFPEVTFIQNTENTGFSAANNKAVSLAKGEYVFLLNPDTELEGNYIKEVLDFADAQGNFGCLGLRMHDFAGRFLPESKRSVPSVSNSFEKIFNAFKQNTSKSYYRTDVAETEIAEVEILTGANLLVKKKVYQEIGGMDERYFMYGEDIDFCYSAIRRGYRNFYYGKYAILHHKGESTVKNKDYYRRFYGAMLLFTDKYYSRKPLLKLVLSMGIQLKFALAVLKTK